jgi:uncharacterized membrane protein YfcA
VRTVPTAEVRRVVREIRFRAGKGLGWGAVAGVAVGALIGAHQKDSLNQAFTYLLSDVATALGGMFVTTVLRQPPDRVVYVAPAGGGL